LARAERRGAPSRGRERLHGLHPVREALRARRRELFRLRLRAERPRPELRELEAAARAAGVAVEWLPGAELERGLPEDARSQGAVLEAGPLPEPSLAELLKADPSRPRRLLALDGVEDPQNLGALARVADAAGASGLLLSRRRAPPLSPAASRASAGALEWLPAARETNLVRSLDHLKSEGFWVLGADPEAPRDVYEAPDRDLAGEVVLVLGAEGRGLRPGVRAVLDHRLRIPMGGRVASLNVAAAAAVLLFEIRRRPALALRP